jgi:hypothetical protein
LLFAVTIHSKIRSDFRAFEGWSLWSTQTSDQNQTEWRFFTAVQSTMAESRPAKWFVPCDRNYKSTDIIFLADDAYQDAADIRGVWTLDDRRGVKRPSSEIWIPSPPRNDPFRKVERNVYSAQHLKK